MLMKIWNALMVAGYARAAGEMARLGYKEEAENLRKMAAEARG